MSISLARYVDITSGLGSGTNFPNRDLIGRIFTGNELLPPQTFIQFDNAADVGSFLGLTSEEYYRALFYFGFTSKTNEQAQALQFARWVNVAVAPMIFSAANNNTTWGTNWTTITSGSFALTIGAVTNVLSSLDFSLTSNLSDVADVIQTAINAESGSGAMWTDATVTVNGGGFTFTGGLATVAYASANISVSVAGGGTDVLANGLLGWNPAMVVSNGQLSGQGAIWANGSLIEVITDALTTSADNSTNFGSFLFLNNLNVSLANARLAAAWNQTQNVLYLYTVQVSSANASSWSNQSTGIGGYGGCCLTLAFTSFQQVGTLTSSAATVSGLLDTSNMTVGMPVTATDLPAGTTILTIPSTTSLTLSANATGSGTEELTFFPLEFPEQLPMMIEAATNYYAINSVQNYMFQQASGLSASVTTNALANTYDAEFINYYGQTQNAGTQISFYQRGVMLGQNVGSNIKDMTAYVNEIWLKDAVSVAFMNLLLALTQIPANAQGQAQLLTVLQDVLNQALTNGTISVGKTLSTAQKVYIGSATGDQDAWYQVQNSGYWANIEIILVDSDYVAQYTLIYSKDDTIRLVEGTQTLI